MTKEERAASRAICDAATEGPWEADCNDNYDEHVHDGDAVIAIMHGFCDAALREANAKFTAHARTALPAALDALDEMERENARMQSRIKELNEHIGRTQYGSDYWKERAQALERAIKQSSICCFLCINDFNSLEQEPCKSCKKKANWEFDQERFKG